jgi:large subunit ribosomal protein L30e|tara:strand:+ start:17029 stop:17301 length:273 start_codon:yes stop_codon:yes gene_type:complete
MVKKVTSVEIKNLIKEGNIIFGTERTLKRLKLGKVKRVLVSSNCQERVLKNIKHYAELSKAEFVKLQYPNDQLGLICKKPFSISVLGITG